MSRSEQVSCGTRSRNVPQLQEGRIPDDPEPQCATITRGLDPGRGVQPSWESVRDGDEEGFGVHLGLPLCVVERDDGVMLAGREGVAERWVA